VPAAWALYVWDVEIPPSEYGHQDQNDANIKYGSTACVPTSVVNSFAYLETQYGVTDLFDGNMTTTINKLGQRMNLDANGVSRADFALGVKSWLGDHGDGEVFMTGKDPAGAGGLTTGIPDWWYIYDLLDKGYDVEAGFVWTNGNGGHCVAVTGLLFDDTNDNGILDAGEYADLGFMDPWNGVELTGTLAVDANGYLRLTYSGGGAGNGGTGIITTVVAEIPEPLTLFTLAMGGWALLRKKK
jgi:hypothetical protein